MGGERINTKHRDFGPSLIKINLLAIKAQVLRMIYLVFQAHTKRFSETIAFEVTLEIDNVETRFYTGCPKLK